MNSFINKYSIKNTFKKIQYIIDKLNFLKLINLIEKDLKKNKHYQYLKIKKSKKN
jgi:hypothetical protein